MDCNHCPDCMVSEIRHSRVTQRRCVGSKDARNLPADGSTPAWCPRAQEARTDDEIRY
jgi:hypothetical protein